MTEVSGTKGVANDRAVARMLEVRATVPVATSPGQQGSAAPAWPDVASLSGLTTALASKPPVDGDRVQQIKRAIANGTFPILPATVADRLLAVRYEWLGNDQA